MKVATRIGLLGALAGVLLAVVALVTVLIWLRSWPALAVLAAVTVVASLVARRLAKRVKPGTVLEFDLDRRVVESHGTDPVSRALSREAVVVRDIVDALDRAAEDERIAAVVARLGNGNVQLAHAQEIRDAVGRFRASGKTAIAFAETFGESGPATVDYDDEPHTLMASASSRCTRRTRPCPSPTGARTVIHPSKRSRRSWHRSARPDRS